jgi:hypothetical protein
MKMTTLAKILLPMLFIILSGCASQSKLAKIPPNEWTELKCSGFLTWHQCREEARALCPKGFYTADYFENYTIQRREVSVACKT